MPEFRHGEAIEYAPQGQIVAEVLVVMLDASSHEQDVACYVVLNLFPCHPLTNFEHHTVRSTFTNYPTQGDRDHAVHDAYRLFDVLRVASQRRHVDTLRTQNPLDLIE
jgi:hypothetical protein